MPGFIQITDTHIVAPGALVCGRSDSATALRWAIETINAKLPLLAGIDCAIVTGDLTDHGTREEYAHFAALMEELNLPWRAIPGNHDQPARSHSRLTSATSATRCARYLPTRHGCRTAGPFTGCATSDLLQ